MMNEEEFRKWRHKMSKETALLDETTPLVIGEDHVPDMNLRTRLFPSGILVSYEDIDILMIKTRTNPNRKTNEEIRKIAMSSEKKAREGIRKMWRKTPPSWPSSPISTRAMQLNMTTVVRMSHEDYCHKMTVGSRWGEEHERFDRRNWVVRCIWAVRKHQEREDVKRVMRAQSVGARFSI